MKLSAPIFHLKRKARIIARQCGIPLHQALDRVAAEEGFAAWSMLAVRHGTTSTAEKLYSALDTGDLVLIGARPGHGKTLLALQVALEATNAGRRAVFFTLEYAEGECQKRAQDLGDSRGAIEFDCSDQICAEHIVRRLAAMPEGTLAVIDYLQLLDQRRDTPPLAEQIGTLREFAKGSRKTMVFLSQIDRSFDPRIKTCPDLSDVRLPNPLDLKLFDRACFLHEGETRMMAVR